MSVGEHVIVGPTVGVYDHVHATNAWLDLVSRSNSPAREKKLPA
jgi:hypothetical protein